MANPQKENGHTGIANEIMEAMVRTHWSSYEIQIALAILRKTYGWNKKEDWVSLSQLSEMSGILRQHVARTITKLKERNIIQRNGKKIGLNKDYEKWMGVLPKQVVPKQVGGATYIGTKVLPKQVPTITIKETIQKKDNFSFKVKNFIKIDWNHPYTKARHKLGKYYLFRGVDRLIYAQVEDKSFIRKREILNHLKAKHG